MNQTKKRILVGLSGGVDSAVAAHLLLQQGYEVVAGFMKNYADESNPHCTTREDRDMAIRVAQYLGIKTFIIFDFRKEYDERIIQYIHKGYQQGITPNPDVLCNSLVKFDLFLEEAKRLGCDGIATGHYARILSQNHKHILYKGVDKNKDQSYFLSGLKQEQLAHAHFPLGDLTKTQVRAIAHEIGLPNAERKDSQGLCFIGKVSMKEFLGKAYKSTPGVIKDSSGTVLGTHPGALFYTIGQREGLGLSGGPWFVVEKNIQTNELIVGHEDDPRLWTTQVTLSDRQWSSEQADLPHRFQAKLRYRQTDQSCLFTTQGDNLCLLFDTPQRAATPGQIAVVYDGDCLIGQGTIISAS